ncbi:MAG: ATP-binding protein [Hyphomicrobiales bacterium]
MFGAFFKTTAVKLTLIYMTVFIAFTIAMVGYLAYTLNNQLSTQLNQTISSELAGLNDHYDQNGIRGLLDHLDSRSRLPGAPALLVTNFQGRGLAGNIPNLPPDFLSLDRQALHPLPYNRLRSNGDIENTVAMVRIFNLPSGFYLIIGRDVGEREEFKQIISGFILIMMVSLVILGFLSWFLVGRRVLRRIDTMSATSQTIVAGNLSERLAIDGSGDEFDRLAGNLNDMLDRIEALLNGLKDVSDNIAHDLKTPLTRMRNRVESVLASKAGKGDMKEALEGTIVESDQLINIFDALLRIARVEAGSSIGTDQSINLDAMVADVVELYEPVAEDEGLTLTHHSSGETRELAVNRELLSQAIANLVDNAIKYAGRGAKIETAVTFEPSRAIITVADDGPGIDAKDFERVKKRFTRLDESRSKSGSGLGLSLVSVVAKLHGGALDFDNNNPGLIAQIELPITRKGATH